MAISKCYSLDAHTEAVQGGRVMITPAEFEDKMRAINDSGDEIDTNHIAADDLMCAVLRDLGYTKGVEIFERMPKWYS